VIALTNEQARCFILRKHGLLGEYKFVGKQGALDFIRQAGCIQFDPVDLCGKNAELTLLARVKGFNKNMLHELLYEDRALFDYPDKQLSIIPVEYWAYFEHLRVAARNKLKEHPEIEEQIEPVRKYIEENGAVCSDDIEIEGTTKWWSAINWSTGSKLSRSVLEQMYSSGDLIVHHKKGTRRYYDLTERYISPQLLNAPDPVPDKFEHIKWRIHRRIGAVGMLWNRASDAWLNIWGLTTENRNEAFKSLITENKITELSVEGINGSMYIQSDDIPLIDEVKNNPSYKPRCEFIAPLDPLMWDRKLIKALFNYHYSWEIYTPPQNRKYGAYVLPILCNTTFTGRIEPIRNKDKNTLTVKNIWHEENTKQTKKLESATNKTITKLAKFNKVLYDG